MVSIRRDANPLLSRIPSSLFLYFSASSSLCFSLVEKLQNLRSVSFSVWSNKKQRKNSFFLSQIRKAVEKALRISLAPSLSLSVGHGFQQPQ